MKITDLAILVLLIFLGVSIKLDIDQRKLLQAEELKSRYNEILFAATEDATLSLLQPDSNSAEDILKLGYDKNHFEVNPNLDKALTRFNETIYENMGIENDKVAQDVFKMHIPMKLVIAYDGYYINAWQDVYNEATGKNETIEMWTPKKPYTYYDLQNKLIVNFTLDDFVYIYNTSTGVMEQGRREQFYSQYPGNLFSSVYFDNIRRQTITQYIEKELGYYSVKYNNIVKQMGLGYTYSIPIIPEDQWKNAIKSTCFIAFMQGMPVGTQSYNTYGFGGTKVIASKKYYGNTAGSTNYYHEDDCSQSSGSNIRFDSRIEAAQNGYFPCSICKP